MEKSFEEILSETDFPSHPLNEAMALCRHYVPNTDNMGESGDFFDLYALIEHMNAAINEAYDIRCHAGCSACCQFPVALFAITPAEWQLIEQFLEKSDPQWRNNLLTRFMAGFQPLLMKLYIAQWMLAFPIRITWGDNDAPYCPFLEDGRCSIYSVRPFYCRTFGLYSVTRKKHTHVYGCHEQEAHLVPQLGVEGIQLSLPSCNTLFHQLDEITRKKTLPRFWKVAPRDKVKELWLWGYAIRKGHL